MFFREYLKNRSLLLLGIGASNLIGFFFFYLASSFQHADVWYGFFLILFIELILIYFDYRKELKRYQKMKSLTKNIDLLKEDLDTVDIDQKYIELLREIYDHYDKIKQQLENRRKDYEEFVSSWIHDVKIPISVLRMILDLDKKMSLDQKESMEEELYQLEEYMNKIMYFIKIADFNNDYIPTTTSLKKVVNRSLKSYSKVFSYKKINLQLEPLKAEIITDEKWFGFIISQILSNALKYTNESGTISIYQIQKENGVALRIKNTGVGIKKGDLKRIFQKGYTGYTGHQENKSTGYGLYLSKVLADKLNLQLTAESNYTKDATFEIFIPQLSDYHKIGK